ncbi:hypothetical protein Tco_1409360 [Tanacetum coccineum]
MLLRHGTGDSEPNMSFDTSASPEYVSGLGCASLAMVISYVSPSVVSGETIPHHVPHSSIGNSSVQCLAVFIVLLTLVTWSAPIHAFPGDVVCLGGAIQPSRPLHFYLPINSSICSPFLLPLPKQKTHTASGAVAFLPLLYL